MGAAKNPAQKRPKVNQKAPGREVEQAAGNLSPTGRYALAGACGPLESVHSRLSSHKWTPFQSRARAPASDGSFRRGRFPQLISDLCIRTNNPLEPRKPEPHPPPAWRGSASRNGGGKSYGSTRGRGGLQAERRNRPHMSKETDAARLSCIQSKSQA